MCAYKCIEVYLANLYTVLCTRFLNYVFYGLMMVYKDRNL